MTLDTFLWHTGAVFWAAVGILAVMCTIHWGLNRLDPEWEESWERESRPTPSPHLAKPDEARPQREYV
jgi:hypothetical protein